MPKQLPQPVKNLLNWITTKLAKLSVYETLSLLISLLGSLSLVFIYYQVVQTSTSLEASSKAAIGDAYANIGTFTLDLDKVFIEKPKLRPYFYQGWDISEDHEDYHAVMGIAEMQLDFFDATLTQLEIRPRENDLEMAAEEKLWEKYFSKSFAKSRVLCKRYADDEDWYRENLKKYASEPCKKWGFDIE
ncbi:MAG TPA: hypothetical protein VGD38_04540 [Pyrinomonadaceae bacterium]